MQALYYKPGASRARIHKLEYERVSGSNIIWVQTWLKQVCLKKASIKSTTIEKARPPAWEPPNYSWSSAVSTSSRHPRGSSSSRRWWHLAPGLHHLIAATRYRGKDVAKQLWVLIQSTRKTYIRSMLIMHRYQRNGVISVDYTAEMPE